jgi:hypothetical protein
MTRAGTQWIALMTGTFERDITSSPADQAFENYIAGRSVAVVAPGILDAQTGPEIDAHDIVYRLKYFGALAARHPDRAGSRCDVAFLNEHHFEGLNRPRRGHMSPLAEVDWVIQKKGISRWTATPARVMSGWSPTALTTGTAGTLALWDLLQFRPRGVKLFGFDFYSRRSQYDEAYLRRYKSDPSAVGAGYRPFFWEDGQLSASHIARTFMWHVPPSDFLLVKRLYQRGLLDADTSVAEVLNCTTDQYLTRLEEMLGNW